MVVKSIIIIGAGLAGLATGCFGQMNGYKTSIFEAQAKPGGVCVSWKRNGYTFDYAVHNLFGITQDSANNKVWIELGAFRDVNTYSFKEFVQVEDTDGKTLTVYTNLDDLQKHMMNLSPKDKNKINDFIKACRRFSGYDLFAAMSGGFWTRIKMLPVMGSLAKYSKKTMRRICKKIQRSFLTKSIPNNPI
jgi:phytoene dehydrogenase-like protein